MPKKPFIVLAISLMALGCLMLGLGLVYQFLLPKAYEATARIKVEKQVDVDPGSGSAPFDPYFIQTEFEKIQSKWILYPVISNLNLNLKWARKLNQENGLKMEVTYALLKNRLEIRQSRNSSLFEISAWSDDPAEAAALANEVARVYREANGEAKRDIRARGIQVLESELAKQEQLLPEAQALMERLRQELSILPEEDQSKASSDLLPDDKRRPYFLAKEELEKLRALCGRLKARIDQEKSEKERPSVELIDLAETPQRPARPNRILGNVILVLGGVSLLTGLLLLLMTVRLERASEP